MKINSLPLQSMLLRIAMFDLHQAVGKGAQNLKILCFSCVHSRAQLITCFLKSWADLWRVWWLLAVSPFVEEPVFVVAWWLAAAWSFRLSALCSLFLSFPGVASLLLCFWAGSFSFDDLLDPLKTEKRKNQVIKGKKEKKKYARPNTSFKTITILPAPSVGYLVNAFLQLKLNQYRNSTILHISLDEQIYWSISSAS